MARDDRRIVSTPSNEMEPLRLPRMPMIDFKVVVLPAPLRPSKVTTSPAFTVKFMPCRMCDSPYQASRFFTSRMVPPPAVVALPGRVAVITSGMTRPQIGFLDALVFRQFGVRSFGKHLTPGQHRDAVRQVRHDAQIVLDHQDGIFGGDTLDQGGDLVDVLVTHAGHRLI